MTDFADDEGLLAWIRALSPEAQAAQLLIVAPDPSAEPWAVAEWLRARQYGGLFLQWRHLADREWLLELVERVREAGDDTVRPFLATDEEGGLVSDAAAIMTTAPSPGALGTIDDIEVTFRTSLAVGDKLRALGFNMVFAPSLDVASEPKNPVIGTRAFGDTADKVVRHGVAAIEGYARAGIIACVKHFPGHGATRLDSHHTLPEVEASRDELAARELLPFRAAIDGGVPAIMTAHVAYPAFDTTGDPATLSPEIVTGLLRQELGFDGVVLTDDMEMEGVAALGDPGAVALQALEAGVDGLLYARNREMAAAVVRRVAEAIRRGEIAAERIEEALFRLARLRRAAQQIETLLDPAAQEEILDFEHEEYLKDVSAAAITLAGGRSRDIPVDWEGRHGLWVVPTAREPRCQVDIGRLEELVEPLGMEVATVGLKPTESERDGVLGRARRADYVIACTLSRGAIAPEQRLLIDNLVALGTPLILVSLLDPHDLAEFPSVRTRLATRGFGPLVLEGLVDVLLGRIVPLAGG